MSERAGLARVKAAPIPRPAEVNAVSPEPPFSNAHRNHDADAGALLLRRDRICEDESHPDGFWPLLHGIPPTLAVTAVYASGAASGWAAEH